MGKEDEQLSAEKLLTFPDESGGGGENLSKLVEEMLSDKNIEGKTDLTSNQIVAFSRAASFGEIYDSKNMRMLIRFLEKFLQSKDRKGRGELVSAITGVFRFELEKAKAQKGEKVEI